MLIQFVCGLMSSNVKNREETGQFRSMGVKETISTTLALYQTHEEQQHFIFFSGFRAVWEWVQLVITVKLFMGEEEKSQTVR